MEKEKSRTYAEAWNAQPDGRSSTELYEDIVQSMRNLYDGKITDPEAHEAARNFIGFCRQVLDVQDRKNKKG